MAKKEISRPQTAGIPPFGLRLQPDLKKRVEDAAIASGRSMNAEIAARLQQSFDSDGLAQKLSAAEHKLDQLAGAGEPGDVVLSPAIRALLEGVAEESNIPMGDALAMLVLAGFGKGSPAVVYVAEDPSRSAGGYMELFRGIEKHVSPDAKLIIEHAGTRTRVLPEPSYKP